MSFKKSLLSSKDILCLSSFISMLDWTVHQTVGLEWVLSSWERGHSGVKKNCRHPSKRDMGHLAVHITALGYSLFIVAISFSTWRYPLKETMLLLFNFRQLCHCTSVKTSELRKCFGQKCFCRHTVMMLELTVTVFTLFVRRWKTDETVWKCTAAVQDSVGDETDLE